MLSPVVRRFTVQRTEQSHGPLTLPSCTVRISCELLVSVLKNKNKIKYIFKKGAGGGGGGVAHRAVFARFLVSFVKKKC